MDNRKYRQKVPIYYSGQNRTQARYVPAYDRTVPHSNYDFHDPYPIYSKPDSVKYSSPQRGSLYSTGNQARVWLGSISPKLF